MLGSDVHIFTASKQPWVVLPEGAVAISYDRKVLWPADGLAWSEAVLDG